MADTQTRQPAQHQENPLHVCFVCTGNVCRSPMAEALFGQLAENQLPTVRVSSAGIGAQPGQCASPETVQLLEEQRIRLNGFASQPIDQQLLAEASHVFTMTRQHLAAVEANFPEFADKLYLITEFSDDDRLRGRDIPDPFGLGLDAYQETRDTLLKVIPSIIAFLRQTALH